MTGTVRDPVAVQPALPAPRTVPLEPGETVGDPPDNRWRVVRHVADGGFSSVYEVRPATPETVDRHGGAPRALKCVWGTPAELTAMNSEAARIREVDGHAGVLELVTMFRFERGRTPHHDVDPVLPHHYVGLVLELADEDLPTFGARVAPDERAWAAVFEQVAAGLEHIHARRVVHGDIKPTNVLRLGARFAVADFGVSAPLESTRSAGIGLARTIAFWPPESATQGVLQADGVRRPPVEGWRASQAGDVWALAVSAHRILTGRHITAGTTPEQQYELVCLGKYAVDGRLGAGWRRLLEDCLVHEPDRRRVTTAAELRRRLAELAVPPAYAGAPWPPGAPRLAALLDLDPAAGGPLLALTLDRPGGRVTGALLPADGVLPQVARHLTEDVLPALAARPTAVTTVTTALSGATAAFGGAGPARAGGAPRAGRGPDPAATLVVTTAELERTRQLSESVSRQRDRMAADRDRLARSRDDVAADRDRLRRDYEILAGRLDRLEREAASSRRVVEREPTRVLAGDPGPPAATAVPVSTVDVQRGRSGRPAAAGRRAGSAPRRMARRLVTLVAVLVAFAVVAVVGTAALFDTTPGQVGARLIGFVDQVRAAGGP
ncbi:MAG: protein kinase domain-containing protein [Mycobacteriales bacterium]